MVLSFVCLVLISVGTLLSPQSPLFWLASPSTDYQDVRLLLAIILVLQLATRPPRHLWFRVVSGMIASLVGFWAINQTSSIQMLALDSFSIFGACLAILVTSLETNTDKLQTAVQLPYELVTK